MKSVSQDGVEWHLLKRICQYIAWVERSETRVSLALNPGYIRA